MRVVQVAPPWFTVPPVGYGGTEAMVSLLADGLVAAGHDVELVASGGSHGRARLRTVYDEPPSELLGDVATELGHALEAYLGMGAVDLIHDHSGLIGAALGAFATDVPVVHTLHAAWSPATARVYQAVADRVSLVAISHDQARRRPPGLPLAGVVHNAVSLAEYPLSRHREGYLLWVGRASADKGPADALAVARELGRPLVMAMKVNEASEHVYLREVLEPAMRGLDVEVRFNVALPEKAELMGAASCLLFPIRWPEPFGLVMVEAMACGTPVVAYANGAAPEVIDDGRTGVLLPEGDVEAMARAVGVAEAFDPLACRTHVVQRFSPGRMVGDYVALYERILGRGPLVAGPKQPPLEQAG